MRLLRTAFTLLLCSNLTAQTLTVAPQRPAARYERGEEVRWVVSSSAAANLQAPTYRVKSGNLTTLASGALTFTGDQAIVSSKLDQPGWLFLEVEAKSATGAALNALGGAIVAPELIQPSTPAPADFDAFWAAKLAEQALVPMNPVVTPGVSGRAGVDYATVTLDTIRGTRIQGQLARPTSGTRFPALLIVQWAGVYSLDKRWATDRAAEGWLTLNTQAHDITPVAEASYYTALQNGALNNYWRIGNEDRDTSYFLRMYVACARAVDYLASRPDWDGRTLVVMGTSQGGLQALVTAGLDSRVTAALAEVPAGSDQTGLDAGRVPGWPQWAYQAWDRDLTKVLQASRYYDVTNFAPRIRCPVLIGVGLLDTLCPPPGVFATYNQLCGEKEILIMPRAEHSDGLEPTHQPYRVRAAAWLAALRQGQPAPVIADPPSISSFQPVIGQRPVNLSVRGPAGSGEDVLIGGFNLAGTGRKTVLLRAAGPALAAAGVADTLPDPLLRVYNAERQLVAENDNWDPDLARYADHARAFAWADGSKDAAALLTLTPGSYTVHVVNRGAGSPEALLEIYDLSRDAGTTLVNVSCRIRESSTPVIVGLTLDSAAPVLVRNGGPALRAHGVTDAASDTRLVLYQGETRFAQNDSWAPALGGEFARLGAFPYGESALDAALLLAEPPAQFTAHATAVGPAGVGLVELYLAR